MDIVDAQVHMGPGDIPEKIAAMDALGISSVLIDEFWIGRTGGKAGDPGYRVGNGAFRTTSPTAELASWTYPGRFSYVVRVDYEDPELRHIARFASEATYARALRITTPMPRSKLTAFADGAYDCVFAAASDFGLPIFVSVLGHTHLMIRYLEKFPDCKVIICHCGMPPEKSMVPLIVQAEGQADSQEYWSKLAETSVETSFEKVLQIAKYPNVAIKWAHAPARFGAGGYPNEGARRFLRLALNEFGPERIMWASDFTANQSGETWAELLFTIKDNPDLSDREREYILGRTARSWLSWEV